MPQSVFLYFFVFYLVCKACKVFYNIETKNFYKVYKFLMNGRGEPIVMASSFGPVGPGSIPDAAKDLPSKCGVLARKIRGSESPVVGH